MTKTEKIQNLETIKRVLEEKRSNKLTRELAVDIVDNLISAIKAEK